MIPGLPDKPHSEPFSMRVGEKRLTISLLLRMQRRSKALVNFDMNNSGRKERYL